ncbi:MAG: hypothetical protein WC712_06180 [Candidatus Brocadiia bacterium]
MKFASKAQIKVRLRSLLIFYPVFAIIVVSASLYLHRNLTSLRWRGVAYVSGVRYESSATGKSRIMMVVEPGDAKRIDVTRLCYATYGMGPGKSFADGLESRLLSSDFKRQARDFLAEHREEGEDRAWLNVEWLMTCWKGRLLPFSVVSDGMDGGRYRVLLVLSDTVDRTYNALYHEVDGFGKRECRMQPGEGIDASRPGGDSKRIKDGWKPVSGSEDLDVWNDLLFPLGDRLFVKGAFDAK